MVNWRASFRYFDWLQLATGLLLTALGLLMVYSTNLEAGPGLLLRQIIFAIIGFVGLIVLAFYDYRKLKKVTPWLYVVIILSLLLVFFWGVRIRGSTRWIDLGFFRFQPAEFAKLVMVVIMAKFLDQQGEKLKDLRYVVLSGIYILAPVILIVIEPDLGSSLIIFFTWLATLLFSRMNKRHLFLLLVVVMAAGLMLWKFGLHDYQKNRIYSFLDPSLDPKGRGYNVLQSKIAVGSGGFFGRGLGRGFQSQLKFLPERQSDFIFASTAEELGLLGSGLVLGLYVILFFRIIRTAKIARDSFGTYLALGIFFMLFFQVIINIGMNIGILPVTGIPLPLLSAGGSSLITTFWALGLVQSIVARQKAVKFGF